MNLQRGQASIDKGKGTTRPLQDFATSPAHATSPARVASSSPRVPDTALGGASAQAIRDRSRSRTLRADSYDNLQDFGLYNAPSPVRPAGNLHESSSRPSSRSRGPTPRSREPTPRSKEPTPISREATPKSQSSGADSGWNGFSSSPSPFPAPSPTNQPKDKGERRAQRTPTGKGKKVFAPHSSRWGSTTSRAAVKPGLKATRPVRSYGARRQDKVTKSNAPRFGRKPQKQLGRPLEKGSKDRIEAEKAAVKAARKEQEALKAKLEKAQRRIKDAEKEKKQEKERYRKEQKKKEVAQEKRESKGLKMIKGARERRAKVATKASEPKKAAHTARHTGAPKRGCTIM
ncbi:hypothetical protein HBI67_144450 [Parastagonospora nodorum]|nr:hypothetical protein HBH52_150230 [Parastagonospora nodorum]KAH4061270.1 hypothetical protein HBH49_012990 [Parastagonospora nodorum]KAH5529780.1 hypothetical protein HBI29_020710 [Parastagonospora nodorum]KAH5673455.1 hypothetical protein HBI21_149330 [Parastagonospora nodorum]KAH6062661.1 hypothetical protein HBI67_144450 [Parastagonospora nodorum]